MWEKLVVVVALLASFVAAAPAPVVLDIGHQSNSRGAASPDRAINEYKFWCTYVGEV